MRVMRAERGIGIGPLDNMEYGETKALMHITVHKPKGKAKVLRDNNSYNCHSCWNQMQIYDHLYVFIIEI